jgi:hypothetical protein
MAGDANFCTAFSSFLPGRSCRHGSLRVYKPPNIRKKNPFNFSHTIFNCPSHFNLHLLIIYFFFLEFTTKMKFTTAIAAIVVAVFARTVIAAPAPQGIVAVDGIPVSGGAGITLDELTDPSYKGSFTNF